MLAAFRLVKHRNVNRLKAGDDEDKFKDVKVDQAADFGFLKQFKLELADAGDLSDDNIGREIAMDLLSILPLGASSFALVLIVFAVHIVSHQLYQVRIVSILVMTVLSTFFLQFFTWQILVLLGNSYDIPALIRLVLMPTIVYNLAAALPVYGFVRWMQKRLEGQLQSVPSALTQEAGARTSL